ncbi:SMI1/KNR4 family protein [Brevibacillus sp. 179-C 1.1 NHS]|uniref:SMI1/KNR4 family protein n=1 Tax=Brevibacillus sp. 179-C 1.1 NHS TaxID=3235177 RepID=UPI0039A33D51
MSFVFPDTLRNFYLDQASSIKFNWESKLRIFGDECKFGGINLLSPTEIISFIDEMQWLVQESKDNHDELNNNLGLQALVDDWPHWLPVISFENGDAFCIDRRDHSIVFLEHDVMDGGPNVHGVKIACSFEDLIRKWSTIGFVDIYDWTDGTNESGIDLQNSMFESIIDQLK